MAVLQRVAFYPNERLDIPDARALEGFGLNDWTYFSSGFLSDQDEIVQGFEISNYANIFLVPGFTLRLSTVAMFHPTATTQAAGFYVTNGEEPDAVVTLSSNATNFVEVDFQTSSGTPDIRAFWDPGANAGAGGEYTQTVDTAVNLSLEVFSNVSGFTSGRVPLYKVVTNSSGVVTSVTDCRPMFFRLGSGGNTPDPQNTYAWPSLPDAAHARSEPPSTATTATTGNAPFQGGDKNIRNLKQFFDALMSVIKEFKATKYWYSPTVGGGLSGVYQNAALTILVGGTWTALGLIALSTAATSSTLTVQPGTAFTAGASTFTCNSTSYSYTSYTESTGVFAGVSPSPASIPNGSAVLQGEFGHLELAGGSTIYRMGAQNNGSLNAFSDMDLTAYPDLWVLLPSTDTAVTYGMGADGATPVKPRAATALTPTSITVATGGNYATGGGALLLSGQTYAYTGYNAGTGLFTGVTPDPSGANVGDLAYADVSGGVSYYQITSRANVPGVVAGVDYGATRVYWLAVYDGLHTIRLREGDLQPGEVVNVGDNYAENISQYIGSNGPSDTFPVYDVPTLIPDGTSITAALTIVGDVIETPIYDEVVTVPVVNLAQYHPVGTAVDGPLVQAVSSWNSQGFTPTATASATQAAMKFRTVGSPDFYFVVDIQTDNAGVPSGTVVATSSAVHTGQISSSFQDVALYFASAPSLTSGTPYHLVVRPLTANANTIDGTDYLVIAQSTGSGLYGGGNPSTSSNSGAAWSPQTGYTLRFSVNDYQGYASGATTALPVNSKTSQPQTYTIGSSALVVYVDGVFMEPSVDYTESSSSTVTWIREVEANSRIRFRIGNIGGANVSSSAQSLQAAYNNGATITVLPGTPLTINGSSGKLLVVNGDVTITGVIDPKAITFTPEASDPIAPGQYGLWVSSTQGLMYDSQTNGTLAVEQAIAGQTGQSQKLTRTMTNGSGATIAAGTPVYISGTGQVSPAYAGAPSQGVAPFFGIAMTTMAANASGAVCFAGTANGILSGMTSGTYLWLSATPGQLATSPPGGGSGSGYLNFIVGVVDGNDLILQPHYEGGQN